MGKDIVIGMSATFVLWVAILGWATSRLVCLNIKLYKSWRYNARDTQVRLALWLSFPLLMAGLLMMRSAAIYGYLTNLYTSEWGITQAIVFLPTIMLALALALWAASDRAYGPEKGDRLWCRTMWFGLFLGISVAALSWWF